MALRGLRVLEVGNLAAAYCGKLLFQLGAEVTRIDLPDLDAEAEAIGGRETYDRGKHRRQLHSLDGKDGEVFASLAANSDILLDAAWTFRLDVASLRARHPHLIVASLTPFGRTGAWSTYKGSDLVCQAAAGMVFLSGSPDGRPLPLPGLQAYHAASLQAAIAILLALLDRRRTGQGQDLDISIQEAAAACVEHATSRFFADGTIESRRGGTHWNQEFRHVACRDGYVVLGARGDWTTLVEWLKADGKAEDLAQPGWEDASFRYERREHVLDVLTRWAQDYSVADLVDAAQARRLPFAPVLSPRQLLSCPQLRARNFFLRAGSSGATPGAEEPGPPFRFEPWPAERRTTPRPAEGLNRRPGRGALSGLRVLDFTWMVAGPIATRVLADHGAEVVHIEPIRAPLGEAWSRALRRGKKSLRLNLDDPRGLDLARRLAESADIVVDNFSPRVMRHWGLHHAALRQRRGDIVAVSMSGFGQNGPWRDHVAYAPTLQALVGFSDLMRGENAEPIGCGFSFSDVINGLLGAVAILSAIWHRERTGDGGGIDLSQLEAMATLLGPEIRAASEASAGLAIDNGSPEMPSAAHGIYACATNPDLPQASSWCAMSLFREEDWQALGRAMGSPPWFSQPPFRVPGEWRRHRKALDSHIEAWTRRLPAEAVVTRLRSQGIAAAVVANARDLCQGNAHLKDRGFFPRAVDGEEAALGALQERLGLTVEYLLELRSQGVIA